eukprot:Skav225727  [mRNA]  locus=scaffold611:63986:72261:+ [translate_table: standard]
MGRNSGQRVRIDRVLSTRRESGGESKSKWVTGGDLPGEEDETNKAEEAADFKCRDWTKDETCRSGLPFYRLQMNHDMTPDLCFEFCIGAGLDLFGLVGEECRCGASLLNKDAYPYMQPGIYSTSSCWAYLGRPSSFHKINLGWCKTLSHKGNIAHEIGHGVSAQMVFQNDGVMEDGLRENDCCLFVGLGINHEQKRADGSQEYYGKGPHLEMFWENSGDKWSSQYTPSVKSYIGSADDGNNDPQVGYAEYDFESIMHYFRQRSSDRTINNGKSWWNHVEKRGNVGMSRVGQGDWQSFSFAAAFAEPPVVIAMSTGLGESQDVKIRSVTTTGFQALLVVPPKGTGNLPAATVPRTATMGRM